MNSFGFTNPILIDQDNVVIAGHGRLLAAKALGLAEAPTIMLSHLSEAQKRALRLADNKIALNSGWDDELLRVELIAVTDPQSGIDAGALGFSPMEIDLRLTPKTDPDDDALPATKRIHSVLSGDVYALGDHRVGCGDARDANFVRSVMGEGRAADAAFLDPPYNVRINGHANVERKHAEFAMASGEMTETQFSDFLGTTLGAAAQCSRNGAVHFVCMDWRHGAMLERAAAGAYQSLINLCVWNKNNAGMGGLYRSKHELVYVFKVGEAPPFNAVQLGKHGRNRTNVWDYPSVNTFDGSRREDLRLHPTVKPVAMVADAIRDVTRRGDRVLDLFLGSGTSLIAAERAERVCCGVEIDPAYVDVALQRWSDMTGGKPELLERGKAGDGING